MDALHFARELIAFDSVSRVSNGAVSEHVAAVLRSLHFETELIAYEDAKGVRKVNVIGRRGPAAAGGLAYFCHTDVVPADDWHDDEHGPFDPIVRQQRLYGRGSCDMKGSLATMLAAIDAGAAERYRHPLYVVATADEEVGFLGAREVAQRSSLYGDLKAHVELGIIGEPTGLAVVHAHKGSCAFRIVSRGEAAHSSSAAGRNANLAMIPFLAEMKAIYDSTESDRSWQDERFDPPTLSWNIGINDHTHAINIKAAQSVCTVYMRPMPGMDVTPLIDRVTQKASELGLDCDIFFEAKPFYADPELPAVKAMLELTGTGRARTVCYGTDAVVFSELGRIVVCGPGDIAQAHTKDEWISLEQLTKGTDLYRRAIERWCLG